MNNTLKLTLAAGLFILMIIATAPAKILDQQLKTNLRGFQGEGINGSLWSGQYTSVQYSQYALQNLNWDLAILPLFIGSVSLDLDVDDSMFKGNFRASKTLSSEQVSDMNGVLSIQELFNYLPAMKYLNARGTVLIQDLNFSFKDTLLSEITGSLTLNNAAITVNGTTIDFGIVNVIPTLDNQLLTLNINSDQQLAIDAIMTIDNNRRYQLRGSIRSDLPANIKNTLRYVAKDNGQGRMDFNLPGKL